jgi:thiol-disulfide isomerase/thioredoxin
MSTKTLIGMLLAGITGVVIFLFVHLSGDPRGGPIQLGSSKAEACTKGARDCLPEVNYMDTQGKAYTPKSLTGQVVIVNFWGTFCPPCKKEIPDLSAAYDKYKDKGLVVLGVMSDDPSDSELLNFASDFQMTYPIVRSSSDIQVAFGYPDKLPTTFVFSRGGKQVFSKIGALRADEIKQIIEPLLAEKL